MLAKQYQFLLNEKSPAILVEMMKHYGVKEVVGKKHNPVILNWASEIGWGHIKDDETPWCGTLMGYCAKMSGVQVVKNAPRALAWNEYGTKQTVAKLGDILTFSRQGGGHVGLYVGEDDTCYHVLGGNQGNAVSIVRIEKSRLSQIRRTNWKIAEPANVRQIFYVVSSNGTVSKNEA